MNNNEIIDEILAKVKQPLWGCWYVREKIGSGDSGAVFRGEAVRRNQTEYSAIKVEPIYAGELSFRDEARKQAYLDERFNEVSHESTTLYKLKDCPNIVTYKDEYYSDLVLEGKKEGYFFIRRMELLYPVSDLMRAGKFDGNEKTAKKLALGVGSGLATAHASNILHRDIRPENFYRSKESGYKLGGFNSYTNTDYVGPEDYMAPEVYRAKNRDEKYNVSAEVFSFGMCLYQICNRGLLPFEGPNTTREAAIDRRVLGAQLPPPCDASPEFADMILRACAPDPAARYQTVGQFLADLNSLNRADSSNDVRAALGKTVYTPEEPSVPEYDYADDGEDRAYARPPRSKSSNRSLAILLVAAIIALIAVAGAGIFYALRTKDSSSSSSDEEAPAAEASTGEDATDGNSAGDVPYPGGDGETEPSSEDEEATTEDKETSDEGFVIDQLSLELVVGGTATPYVSGYPDGMTESDEVWESDDEDVATVNGYGKVTGIAPGKCNIYLSNGSDPSQRISIGVSVTEKPERKVDLSASPAPEKDNTPGLTYIQGILVANKTYSLPSTYNPGDILPLVRERFNAMAKDAAEDGIRLEIVSGFRSYDYQNQLYEGYAASDPSGYAGADTYSARPGHSEHQTGLAMDINNASSSFEGTPEAIWLAEHCWEYGFIIRYGADKVALTGYKYEPWHIRYVGGELAKELTESGLCLEEYLGIDSVYQN